MMKREGKNVKKKDGLVTNNANCKKVMSSNLPLLFANGRPRSLETISQPELEEFVPFMILCSLGQEVHLKPKEINKCPVPEWWPQGFPFKFPLVEQSDWINRQVMLKSLVCRCYTFYDCEFLLKFSSELAEMAPSNLKYEENKGENTTSIYNASGRMLVKCRNENLNYDVHKNPRRYLSPIHRSPMNQAKKFEPVIDLTFDTSSEDEKEVYFKEAPSVSGKRKRKGSIETCDEPLSKRCAKRMFNDFAKEEPEPEVLNQEQFMEKFNLIQHGKEVTKEKEILKVDRKKRLAHCFSILSVTCRRGQELLEKNKHCFNLEASLERINRFCSPDQQEEEDSNQVCTRSSAVLSSMYKNDAQTPDTNPPENNAELTDNKYKWCHSFRWPRRTNNPYYHYIGPSLKQCSVILEELSEATINYWTKRKRTVATMTPDGWWKNKPLCACHTIPLIYLDDESHSKYKDKGTSTRCTCDKSRQQATLISQVKKISTDVKKEVSSQELQITLSSQDSSKTNQGSASFTPSRSGISGSYHSGFKSTHSYSNPSDKGGIELISGNTWNGFKVAEPSLQFKRVLHRRPLTVVPVVYPRVEKELFGLSRHAILCPPPENAVPISLLKIKCNRSILDAIKWYTKDDNRFESPLSGLFTKEMETDRAQENIKPYSELCLPNTKKTFDYTFKNMSNGERDYCFERTSDGTSKLVTRSGERHYVNREPCPLCFQGKDNFCVYEFIRQAKAKGVSLCENQKQLQIMFFNVVQEINSSKA